MGLKSCVSSAYARMVCASAVSATSCSLRCWLMCMTSMSGGPNQGQNPFEHSYALGVLALCEQFDIASAALHFLGVARTEEHKSELQSLMRKSYALFCLKKKQFSATH